MADFSALKQSIETYIKNNGNKEITGAILQNILLSMVTTMGDGAINDNASDISDIKDNIQNINGDITNINGDINDINGDITNINGDINDINGDITDLNGDLSDEVNRAEGAEGTLQHNITAEENRAKGAETTTVIFSDGKLVFKNAAGTVLYQLSVDSFLSAITTRLNTGALYAGFATPSTTPAALTGQEVFYLATQAGTYTNFHFNGGDEPIVLTKDGIYFIVSGTDDDDWNAEPMLQLDDVPTASSNNAVKSGGVAEELALGAVYDVSAKNPTAGPNNDGKWESLSALFSDANLSTLIPASVRKGGMSIKFVQSSDNKYVQFRYMGSSTAVADFTNVANWQGVDTELIDGSKNLVESGGVKSEFYKQDIQLGIEFDVEFINGYWNNHGEFVSGGPYNGSKGPIPSSKLVYVKGKETMFHSVAIFYQGSFVAFILSNNISQLDNYTFDEMGINFSTSNLSTGTYKCYTDLEGKVIPLINEKINEGYLYKSIATGSTNPGTPKGKVFYITNNDGNTTYTNFKNGDVVITVPQGLSIIKYDGTWSAELIIDTVNIQNDVSNLQKTINSIFSNLLSFATILDDKFVNGNGNIVDNATGSKAYVINVKGINTLAFLFKGVTPSNDLIGKIAFDEGSPVGWGDMTRSGNYYIATVPNGANYVYGTLKLVTQSRTTDLTESLMIVNGSEQLPSTFVDVNSINISKRQCNRAFYACGDSTTYGAGSVGGPGPGGVYSWSDKVAERISFSTYENFAISGGYCMYDSNYPTKYLLSEINSIPQLSDCIVPIMIGTNDYEHQHALGNVSEVLAKSFESLQDGISFAESFRLCVETLKRKCPLATIICMTPVSPQPGDNLTIPLESYKEVERAIAKAFAIPIVETSEVCGITYRCNYRDIENEPVFVTEEEVSTSHVCMSDRLHPTNLGYELIARYMVSYLSGMVESWSN